MSRQTMEKRRRAEVLMRKRATRLAAKQMRRDSKRAGPAQLTPAAVVEIRATEALVEQLSVDSDGAAISRGKSLDAIQKMLLRSLTIHEERGNRLQSARRDLKLTEANSMKKASRQMPYLTEVREEATETLQDEEPLKESLDSLGRAIAQHNRECDQKGHRELRIEGDR